METAQINILIVDDLVENLMVLDRMLANKGYKVRKAINGKLALNTCESTPPDLILLDIRMPDLNGYDLCKILKNNPKTKDIPVIFISALNEVFDKVQAFNAGGVDYITKPFELGEVIVRIENQLMIKHQKLLLQKEIEQRKEKEKLLEEEIKKRRETEEILYQSRALLASVLNCSLDGITALESVREPLTNNIVDFRCLVVNPILANFLGKAQKDLIGKSFFKKLINKIEPNLFDKFINVVQTGKPLQEDLCYTNKDNQTYFYHLIAVKLGDGFSISVIDITDRKKMELELRKTNQDLEAFTYSVSHDLKNYINQICGFAQLLVDDDDPSSDPKQQEYVNYIVEGSITMNQIIEDLLLLSQVKYREINIEPLNLSYLVQEILFKLQKNEPTRKLELNITSNLMVQGDKGLLKIALENLINNAWKYTQRQKIAKIEFGLFSENNKQKVYFIKDNGVGFDSENAKELFTPFKRFHSKFEFQGTGIGLSTVKRIIELHGGTIWCEAKINQGATFFFTL